MRAPARAQEAEQQGDPRSVAKAGGFSLHAGLEIPPHQRARLECLSLTSSGQVRYHLKTPYRDGTTHHEAMTWAQRLKRVFGIEINTCTGCGGKLKVIASIEEPEVIASILARRDVGRASARRFRWGAGAARGRARGASAAGLGCPGLSEAG